MHSSGVYGYDFTSELLWYIQMEILNRQETRGPEVQGRDLTTRTKRGEAALYRTTARL